MAEIWGQRYREYGTFIASKEVVRYLHVDMLESEVLSLIGEPYKRTVAPNGLISLVYTYAFPSRAWPFEIIIGQVE